MNEQILIYLLCTDLSAQLNQILHMKRSQLKSKPGDIPLSADIRKLQNDIAEVNRVANQNVEGCVQFLAVTYSCKFQFMVPEEKKPTGVDGKEIKLTVQ